MVEVKRMWINQPSTRDVLHHLHGTNVLGYKEKRGRDMYRIYFLSGDIISMRVMNTALSNGWINRSSPV